MVAVLVALSTGVAAGCGSGSITEAYQQAHPGFVDGPLQPAPAEQATIVAAIRKDHDPAGEIWLPEYLPAGFVLAAPYNGDGSGSAQPNPYAWGRGYSVTYTDGVGYVMVLANSDDDLTQGEWSPLAENVAGRALRLQRGPGIVLVATVDDGGPPLLVSGGGFGGDRLEAELIHVAESLAGR